MNSHAYTPADEESEVVDENSSVTLLAAEVVLTLSACNQVLDTIPDDQVEAPDFWDPLYLRIEWLTAAKATTADEIVAKAKALSTLAPDPIEIRRDNAFALLEASILRDLRELVKADSLSNPDQPGAAQ
jgi:hypothetical protein